MREIPAGSYFKDVLTGEGRERSPLGVNQGILISSNGMVIKVEEHKLEHREPPYSALLRGPETSVVCRAGGPVGDRDPLQLMRAGVIKGLC